MQVGTSISPILSYTSPHTACTDVSLTIANTARQNPLRRSRSRARLPLTRPTQVPIMGPAKTPFVTVANDACWSHIVGTTGAQAEVEYHITTTCAVPYDRFGCAVGSAHQALLLCVWYAQHHRWRKFGEKRQGDLLRSYYKCSQGQCRARKWVQPLQQHRGVLRVGVPMYCHVLVDPSRHCRSCTMERHTATECQRPPHRNRASAAGGVAPRPWSQLSAPAAALANRTARPLVRTNTMQFCMTPSRHPDALAQRVRPCLAAHGSTPMASPRSRPKAAGGQCCSPLHHHHCRPKHWTHPNRSSMSLSHCMMQGPCGAPSSEQRTPLQLPALTGLHVHPMAPAHPLPPNPLQHTHLCLRHHYCGTLLWCLIPRSTAQRSLSSSLPARMSMKRGCWCRGRMRGATHRQATGNQMAVGVAMHRREQNQAGGNTGHWVVSPGL